MSAKKMLVLPLVRAQMADVLEELGTVAMHLREAMECAEGENLLGAMQSAEDATETMDSALRELTGMRELVGRWVLWAEGRVGTSNVERPTSNIEVEDDGKEGA